MEVVYSSRNQSIQRCNEYEELMNELEEIRESSKTQMKLVYDSFLVHFKNQDMALMKDDVHAFGDLMTNQPTMDDMVKDVSFLLSNMIGANISLQCLINCMWALSVVCVKFHEWFMDNISIEDICLRIMEIDLSNVYVLRTAVTLLGNVTANIVGRNIVLDTVGMDNVIFITTRVDHSKEAEHLLYNMFRFGFDGYDINSMLTPLLAVKNPMLVMNCSALAAQNIGNFQDIARSIGLVEIAKKYLLCEIDKRTVSSCSRFLGRSKSMNVETASKLLSCNLDDYNDELASAVVWALINSFPIDINSVFELDLHIVLFNIMEIGSYMTKKYVAVLLSKIACNCGDMIEILTSMNYVRTVAPFVRCDCDTITTKTILEGIVICSGAEEAEDLLGDSIDDIIRFGNSRIGEIATIFIRQIDGE